MRQFRTNNEMIDAIEEQDRIESNYFDADFDNLELMNEDDHVMSEAEFEAIVLNPRIEPKSLPTRRAA